MKKLLILILTAVLVLSTAACGKQAAQEDPDALNTLGDAFAVGSETNMSSYDSRHYVYVFEKDGVPMRVTADIPGEVYDKLEDLIYDSEDTEEKVRELVAGLKLSKVEDLSENVLSQEELDKLKGKTGQELLDAGYTISGYSIDEDYTDFFMDYGDFEYVVSFNESLNNVEITDEYAQISGLTVKEAKYSGVSYTATDIGID